MDLPVVFFETYYILFLGPLSSLGGIVAHVVFIRFGLPKRWFVKALLALSFFMFGLNIIFLNPKNSDEGYYIETGWASGGNQNLKVRTKVLVYQWWWLGFQSVLFSLSLILW